MRASGVSPLTVFFDATGTRSGTTSKPFTQIRYSWNFGDSGASGTGKWKYGSNPGQNSMNTAAGAVAAHVFSTQGADQTYTVTLTAFDGTNSATCQMAVTAYAPSGPNGYPGTATTCVSSSAQPVAGLGGCPAGAKVLKTSSYVTALASPYLGSGKRVLFNCGDSFSGSGATISGSNWRVGAYGGCEGTTSGRPILNAANNGEQMITIAQTSSDGAIADLDLEGNGRLPWAAIGGASNTSVPSRITLLNLAANNMAAAYWWDQGKEWALVGSTTNQMSPNSNTIGTFVNYSEWNPGNDVSYQAVMGNSLDGNGGWNNGSGQETLRISACAKCVISNNDVKNANGVGAVLKFHQGNTNNSNSNWVGSYSETTIISDNHFSGSSGANLVEVAPQNSVTDERLRNIVIERNFFQTSVNGGRELLVSGQDIAVRDNIFSLGNMDWGVQIGQRGNFSWRTTGVEAYNNTCYSSSSGTSNQRCIILSNTTLGGSTPPSSCTVKNTLVYFPRSSGAATIMNDGNGNSLSNNTTNVTANPAFTNASGKFSAISDFRPTASYSGGTNVPVYDDIFGTAWAPTWDMGAVHH